MNVTNIDGENRGNSLLQQVVREKAFAKKWRNRQLEVEVLSFVNAKTVLSVGFVDMISFKACEEASKTEVSC